MSARMKPAKRRAEKPVDREIRRAAKRAGIKARDTVPSPPPEPHLTFDDYMRLNQGEQIEKLLRQVGHTDDRTIGEYLARCGREIMDRAAVLGVKSDTATLRETHGFRLIRATELLSEALAVQDDRQGGSVADLLREASIHVWKLRWEMGVLPNDTCFVLSQGEEDAS